MFWRHCWAQYKDTKKIFEKKIEVEKSAKCAQGQWNHKISSCIKASQARTGPDPCIMAKGLVNWDLASRSPSEELRFVDPSPHCTLAMKSGENRFWMNPSTESWNACMISRQRVHGHLLPAWLLGRLFVFWHHGIHKWNPMKKKYVSLHFLYQYEFG